MNKFKSGEKVNKTRVNYTKVNYLHTDDEMKLLLKTDASTVIVGAVLQQVSDSVSQPISFFSAKLTSAERNYSTFSRELLAIYLAVKN